MSTLFKTHITRDNIIKSDVSPISNITPSFVGQICITGDNKVFFANGFTANDWIEAGGSGDALDDLQSNISTLQSSVNNNKAEITSLKQSVSNGKQLIASAITDKEIPTSNTDSFQTMANNIKNIKTGIKVTMNGEFLDYDFELKHEGAIWLNEIFSTIPYGFYKGSAVVYNNEIHILGGIGGRTAHYKYNGSSWVSVSTIPSSVTCGSAVVYNNEIHILGGIGDYTRHYKYNGSSWVSVSTIPYGHSFGSAVVFDNEIHILGTSSGSNYYKNHYKYNGSSWVSVSTLPYDYFYGSAVVYNNEIHILGGHNSATKHSKWNGSSWDLVSTLPYEFTYGSAVVYDNAICMFGTGSTNQTGNAKYLNVYNLLKY